MRYLTAISRFSFNHASGSYCHRDFNEIMKRNLIFSENFIQLFSRNQSLVVDQCSFLV